MQQHPFEAFADSYWRYLTERSPVQRAEVLKNKSSLSAMTDIFVKKDLVMIDESFLSKKEAM